MRARAQAAPGTASDGGGARHRVGDNDCVSNEPLQTATRIAQLVRDHGGRAFIVGGFVRDRLLGRDVA